MATTTLLQAFDSGASVDSSGQSSGIGGWFWDTFNPNIVIHYGEEGAGVHALLLGGNDGHLYQYLGNDDDSIPISLDITTPSRDQGDPRANKYYLDSMLDVNTDSLDVLVTPYINNNDSSLTPTVASTLVRELVTIPTSTGNAPTTARNLSLNFRAQVEGGFFPKLYIWQPRFAPETATTSAMRWTTAPNHFGLPNYKHIGTCKITHVSLVDLSLIVIVDGAVQTTITIPNSGGVYAETYFRMPVFKGKLFAFDLQCTSDFRLAEDDTWFEMGEWDRGDWAYQKIAIFSSQWV